MTREDIECFFDEISLVTKVKTAFCKALCHVERLCGESREIRLQKRAASRFEE